jgi:hypothetical protein
VRAVELVLSQPDINLQVLVVWVPWWVDVLP